MAAHKHRRAQIIDALYDLCEPLRADSDASYGDAFPLQVKTVQKRYRHWTVLEQQGAIPALLLNFDEVLRKRDGGANTEFAALGETEEYLPIALDVVLKESPVTPRALTDQVSDAIYTIESLINGTPDLDVEGVYRTRIAEVHTSAGRITALQGTPFEIARFRIIVTHIYPSNQSV
ncbi:hypothetical protein F4Z98_16455 [Candidatus Poribacteria bacterium]|nr:hypothetical protein [Candidatus Poribacteria bacterium]MXV84950.1 hypothetical protein [Candidatus Poribacteria bacterium]MYC40236.1 hypothetical protein [Candidatus Dadabacteria bacterium]